MSGKKPPHFLSRSGTWHLAPGTSSRGFTLVEMIVSVALFSVVMLVSVSALLALVNANRKAQALQSVMNNLNIALDGMVRSARMGVNYHGAGGDSLCGGFDFPTPHDCVNGGAMLAFQPYGKTEADPRWIYIYDPVTHRLEKSTDGTVGSAVPITAPEVTIDDLKFYVVGTTRGDPIQPKILIVIKGSAGVTGSTARTTFHIQATSVQRVLDL